VEKINDDIWAEIDGAPRELWLIQPIISSEKCSHRYRKWKPPQKGFFCKLLGGKECNKDVCKFRVRN